MGDSSELVQLTYTEVRELPSTAVTSCYLGKIIAYRKERNAYWGSWSVETPPDAYALKHAHVKKTVEGRRVQGTHFRIIEVPALVISSEDVEVVVSDRSQCPFGQQDLAGLTNLGLRELVLSLTRNNYWAAVLRASEFVLLPKLPFLRYESFPQGPGLSLGWHRHHAQLDIGPAFEALRQICLGANEAAV